jgi:hypothetical protein
MSSATKLAMPKLWARWALLAPKLEAVVKRLFEVLD